MVTCEVRSGKMCACVRMGRCFVENVLFISDSAKIGLTFKTMIVWCLMNLFGIIGHPDRFDARELNNQNYLSYSRWLILVLLNAESDSGTSKFHARLPCLHRTR